MQIAKLNILLMLIFLMILSGCSSEPPIVRTVTTKQTVYVMPPAELISRCRIPEFSGNTNSDHLEFSLLLIRELQQCNVDWAALHRWIEQHKANQPGT